jgi:hypothetical protein
MGWTSFAIGVVVGAVLVPLVFALAVRLLAQTPEPITVPPSGLPDAMITLSRDALSRMIDDALQETTIPLVSLRAPQLQLEPNAVLVLRMRGDTVLLGAQTIVLHMRVVPAANGVQVRTEQAEVGGVLNIAGALTARLDEGINADLAERLNFGDQFEVLSVASATDALTIEARLRDTPTP